MPAAETNAALPSAETLAHAARHVGDAYPGLYAHQRAGVAFLLSRRRAILADDMGLGKSRTAIIALREADSAGPYVIICTAGVKLTWRYDIQQVEPGVGRARGAISSRLAAKSPLDGRQL